MRPSERLRRDHPTPRDHDVARHRCRTMTGEPNREPRADNAVGPKKRRPVDRRRS